MSSFQVMKKYAENIGYLQKPSGSHLCLYLNNMSNFEVDGYILTTGFEYYQLFDENQQVDAKNGKIILPKKHIMLKHKLIFIFSMKHLLRNKFKAKRYFDIIKIFPTLSFVNDKFLSISRDLLM
jgi:hypothetical protein